MIVKGMRHFEEAVNFLSSCPRVSFDTETTGLMPYKNDRLFAIVMTGMAEDGELRTYYWNFQHYDADSIVWPFEKIKKLQPIFNRGTRFAHNAIFDMHFLAQQGIEFNCDIHCTQIMARLLRNDHMSYSLDNCVDRELGLKKDERVETYIEENKLWKWAEIPGKDKRDKIKFFNLVPFDIIHPYAEKDAELCLSLGVKQEADFNKIAQDSVGSGFKSLNDLKQNEMKLTKVCFEMEREGVLVDQEYCERAATFEQARLDKAEIDFLALTGKELTDSGDFLAPIFERIGFPLGLTEKGNFEVTDKFLEATGHPVAKVIQDFRDAGKRANTYFRNYLHYADAEGRIHAGMKQAGTKTGRFSYQNPNLQNVPKAEFDTGEFPVRRAFIPEKYHTLVMIDYDQMEFRMMLDYAKQTDLIKQIQAGHDPHQATSDLTGLTRSQAKTLNFGLLYGMGLTKLAFGLKTLTPIERVALIAYDRLEDKRLARSLMPKEQHDIVRPILDEMKAFKLKYFDALPMVENLIVNCTNSATDRGWVFNWFGRRFHFSDPRFAYRATNSVIQGGCADVVKKAMVALHPALPSFGVKMGLQIHDEIVFNVPNDELSCVDMIKNTMESVYPYTKLKLTCSVSHSETSWGDAVEGLEIGTKSRDQVQGSFFEGTGLNSECVV